MVAGQRSTSGDVSRPSAGSILFPFEAAQEIAGEGISLEDTVLSSTRDQLEAVALILGATHTTDLGNLEPLTYPVPPATSVYHPPAEAVRQLLVGGHEEELKVEIGTLIARADVGSFDVGVPASIPVIWLSWR